MENFIIATAVAAVDPLYWAVFHPRDQLIPPKGDPWIQAVFSAIGGVIGAFAITRLTGQSDLFTAVVGAFIGGRLVGGVINTFRSAPRQ